MVVFTIVCEFWTPNFPHPRLHAPFSLTLSSSLSLNSSLPFSPLSSLIFSMAYDHDTDDTFTIWLSELKKRDNQAESTLTYPDSDPHRYNTVHAHDAIEHHQQ